MHLGPSQSKGTHTHTQTQSKPITTDDNNNNDNDNDKYDNASDPPTLQDADDMREGGWVWCMWDAPTVGSG